MPDISLQAHCNKNKGNLRYAESFTPFQWHKFRLLKLFHIQNPLRISAVQQEVCVQTFINITNSCLELIYPLQVKKRGKSKGDGECKGLKRKH